jgi:DNA transposition AAA+ family ATPase
MTTTTTTTSPAQPLTGSLSISAADFETVCKTYDQDSADTLRFWFSLHHDRNWSLGRIHTITGISPTVLSRVFRNIYDGDTPGIIRKLASARETLNESADKIDFIETSLWRRMSAIFDKTRAFRNVSIVWGRMGIGKTECIKEYQTRNSNRTIVVRFPTGATFAYFVSHVARACGVSARTPSAFDQREKLIRILSGGQRMLIVDELHMAFRGTRTDTAVRCCEFLREISDTARCGLALVGTEFLEESFFRGVHRETLGQLVDRGTIQVPLPPKATQADYRKFLAAYGLDFPAESADPDAYAILGDLIKSAGLRKLAYHLGEGKAFAEKRQEPYAWHHFAAAFDSIQSLSKF